jgi:hypothetical protein
MSLLTKAEDISDIAFGFMGSKALSAALHHNVFTCLSENPMTVQAAATAVFREPTCRLPGAGPESREER